MPDRLSGEAISEYYLSCDAVAPTAAARFTSADQGTYWTFAITTRELGSPPARPRWDLADPDEPQKTMLRKGLQAVIDAEALLFDNCVNNLQIMGLPEWHRTKRVAVDQHELCIGTDAQPVEDGGWVGRAKTPQYLLTVRVEGDKAVQLANVQEATPYIKAVFRQFGGG